MNSYITLVGVMFVRRLGIEIFASRTLIVAYSEWVQHSPRTFVGAKREYASLWKVNANCRLYQVYLMYSLHDMISKHHPKPTHGTLDRLMSTLRDTYGFTKRLAAYGKTPYMENCF
jgi:hypothetical protein